VCVVAIIIIAVILKSKAIARESFVLWRDESRIADKDRKQRVYFIKIILSQLK
jgi:hypothetical protein